MKLRATVDDAGLRLDVWLSRHLPDLSRARVQALVRAGHVDVKGGRALPHQKVTDGLVAVVTLPPPAELDALLGEDIPLHILHEDSEIVVVNKPAGLVVHPAAGHASGTLVNALLYHCDDLAGVGGVKRPGIVHRLDKDTSGVMVVAKTDRAMAALTGQFRRGVVDKEYAALVHGLPNPTVGRIETLIGRSRHDRKKMSAEPGSGRRAVTRYRVTDVFGAVSLLGVQIETGRTHQIRVHMAHIGHPVVGDRQYGGRKARSGPPGHMPPAARQMLHAARLAFAHPRTGQQVEYRAPLPPDMEEMLEALRRVHLRCDLSQR